VHPCANAQGAQSIEIADRLLFHRSSVIAFGVVIIAVLAVGCKRWLCYRSLIDDQTRPCPTGKTVAPIFSRSNRHTFGFAKSAAHNPSHAVSLVRER
jgi:hypothetical protein